MAQVDASTVKHRLDVLNELQLPVYVTPAPHDGGLSAGLVWMVQRPRAQRVTPQARSQTCEQTLATDEPAGSDDAEGHDKQASKPNFAAKYSLE